jgi:hypothetical protein
LLPKYTNANIFICTNTKKRNAVEYLPQIKDFDFRIVSSNAEAEQLAREIDFDFRRHILKAVERLDKGAVAFLIFIQGDFAYIGWAALSPEAKNALDSRPFKVDFEHRQAHTGGSFTFLPYRNKGLMTYGYFRIFEFLEQKGITSTRNVVRVTNLSSQKVHAKFHPQIYAKARHTKILWHQFWKELPLSQ